MKLNIFYSAVIIILLQSLTSCDENQNTGPCEYKEEKFNMTIIDVMEDSTQENMYIVYVDFDGNIEWAKETHTLSEIRNVTTDFDFVTTNHIEPGRVYNGTLFKKIEGSGDCDDRIVDWNQRLIRHE